jgi:hypothetical protein
MDKAAARPEKPLKNASAISPPHHSSLFFSLYGKSLLRATI